jgi:uncharacterized membrane protein
MHPTDESRTRTLHLIALAVIGLASIVPIISSGYIYGHDVFWHVIWGRYFAEQFGSGDFYPQWLMDANTGLGSPVFYFYPPLPFYVASLLKLLLPNTWGFWYSMSLSAALGLVISGLTAYLWLRKIATAHAALFAAVAYMVLPYHLRIDFYQRFAFAEFWAFAWFPLILYFTHEITRGNRKAVLGVAVSYALLVLTHPLTTLLFSAVPLCYGLWMAERGKRVAVLTRISVAMLLGAGLCAFYLFPALTTQDLVPLGDIVSTSHEFFKSKFLFYGPSAESERFKVFWRHLLQALTVTVTIALCAWIAGRTQQNTRTRSEATFWALAAAVTVFMTHPLSEPVWRIIPKHGFIQFPWRILTITTLATSALLAIALSSLKRPYTYRQIIPMLLAAALMTSQLVSGIKIIDLKPVAQLEMVGIVQTGFITAEYRPRWVPDELYINEKSLTDLGRQDKATLLNGAGTARVLEWNHAHIRVETHADREAVLQIGQFYYPGWTATLAEQQDPLILQPAQANGLLTVKIPAGDHQISLQRVALKEDVIGRIISLVSLVILAVLAFRRV